MKKFLLVLIIIGIAVIYVVISQLIGLQRNAPLHQNKSDDRSVYLRIDNATDMDIDQILMGSLYIKPNSYRTTAYQTKFGSLPSGSTSDYKEVHNVPYGYSFSQVTIGDETFAARLKSLSSEFTSQTSWEHPYSGETIVGEGLNAGYYTFTLTNINRSGYSLDGEIEVEITKDDAVSS